LGKPDGYRGHIKWKCLKEEEEEEEIPNILSKAIKVSWPDNL
jgi:hypothetical protein